MHGHAAVADHEAPALVEPSDGDEGPPCRRDRPAVPHGRQALERAPVRHAHERGLQRLGQHVAHGQRAELSALRLAHRRQSRPAAEQQLAGHPVQLGDHQRPWARFGALLGAVSSPAGKLLVIDRPGRQPVHHLDDTTLHRGLRLCQRVRADLQEQSVRVQAVGPRSAAAATAQRQP